MSNITTYAYNKIQNFIAAEVTYLELQDSNGNPIKRFSTADGLTITNVGQTIEYKIVVTGDSTFINQTVSKSVLFDSSTSTDQFATETFTSFTFESAEDELTITHKLEVPEIV